jgi:hypothetical protein
VGTLPPAQPRFASPDAYTPKHLAEKILTSRATLEGERKQVTVLFADLKGSMELLADRDPEEARRLLDPVLERMMEAVGEPGVGKSRLFFEFTRSHRTRGWLHVAAASVSYGRAASYLPVTELLRAYFDLQDRDPAQRIRERVTGKVLTLDERLRDALPPLLSLLEALPEDDPFRSLDNLVLVTHRPRTGVVAAVVANRPWRPATPRNPAMLRGWPPISRRRAS